MVLYFNLFSRFNEKADFIEADFSDNISGTKRHMKGTCITEKGESNRPLVWCLVCIKSRWGNSISVKPELLISHFRSCYKKLETCLRYKGFSPRASNTFNQVVEAKRFEGVFLCRKVC